MFSAAPPPSSEGASSDHDAALGGRWGLRRVVPLAFPRPAGPVLDARDTARLEVYLKDMLRSHGLGPAAADPAGGGASYGEMAEALLGLAVPEREPVDLLVLAYSIPDVSPGRNLTAHLSRKCPGGPLAFAISDQGTAASFTALRLIREYAREAGLRRAVLLAVEQALLPYAPGVPVAIPEGHSGVALLFGDDPDEEPAPTGREVRLGEVVTRAGLHDEALAHEVRVLCADAPAVTLILSSALAERVTAPAGVERVRVAGAGRPFTGIWWELAHELSAANRMPRRVVLGDYDPLQSCLCLAVLEVNAALEVNTMLEVNTAGARPASTAEPLHADA